MVSWYVAYVFSEWFGNGPSRSNYYWYHPCIIIIIIIIIIMIIIIKQNEGNYVSN